MFVHVCARTESRLYKGVVVAPHVPRTEGGLYWGYTVRLASCLSMCSFFFKYCDLNPVEHVEKFLLLAVLC